MCEGCKNDFWRKWATLKNNNTTCITEFIDINCTVLTTRDVYAIEIHSNELIEVAFFCWVVKKKYNFIEIETNFAVN